jgi:hypothetical protein
MITISVNGRIKNKRKVTTYTLDILHDLLPRVRRDVEVDVNIVTRCEHNHYALCSGDKDGAEIELARGDKDRLFTLEEMMLNLAHELVHAKQFIKGELHERLNTWKKLDCSKMPYSETPWEKEAYLLENKLLNKHWK